jgi:hypothetical protein
MNKTTVAPKLVALSKWQRSVGISPVTVWRWRRKGWFPVINIGGRIYADELEIEAFLARAKKGHFAQASNIARVNHKCGN